MNIKAFNPISPLPYFIRFVLCPIYTDELDTYIRQYKDVTSSKQRLLCALALYRDKDTAKAKEIYEATCQRKNKYLMQGEVSSDIALMKSILTAKNAL